MRRAQRADEVVALRQIAAGAAWVDDTLALPGTSAGVANRSRTHELACDPAAAYAMVSDVIATAQHSHEVAEIRWTTQASLEGPSVGDMFIARNVNGSRTWTSVSTVVAAEPGRRFAFLVGGRDEPTALWSFDLGTTPDGTRVSYGVWLPETMVRQIGGRDAAERRLDDLADGMDHLLTVLRRQASGITALRVVSR